MAGWPAHRAGRPRQSLKHSGLLVGSVEPRAERTAHPGGGPNAAIQLKGQMDGHVAALLAMTNKAPAAAVILARINHTFLNKFFYTERTEVQTELTEPNTLSAL